MRPVLGPGAVPARPRAPGPHACQAASSGPCPTAQQHPFPACMVCTVAQCTGSTAVLVPVKQALTSFPVGLQFQPPAPRSHHMPTFHSFLHAPATLLPCRAQEALEERLERYATRRAPLGADRQHRRYWWGLAGHRASVWVEDLQVSLLRGTWRQDHMVCVCR